MHVVEDFCQDDIIISNVGGTGTTVLTVDISPIIDDDVNEMDEGFWLLIEVENRDDITIERRLALVIIKDNDREFDCITKRIFMSCMVCVQLSVLDLLYQCMKQSNKMG